MNCLILPSQYHFRCTRILEGCHRYRSPPQPLIVLYLGTICLFLLCIILEVFCFLYHAIFLFHVPFFCCTSGWKNFFLPGIHEKTNSSYPPNLHNLLTILFCFLNLAFFVHKISSYYATIRKQFLITNGDAVLN